MASLTPKFITIDSLRPAGGGSPRFEGSHYGATTSFFVVTLNVGGLGG